MAKEYKVFDLNPAQIVLELVGGPWDGKLVAVNREAICKPGAYVKVTDIAKTQILEYVLNERLALVYAGERAWKPWQEIPEWQIGSEPVRVTLRQSPRHLPEEMKRERRARKRQAKEEWEATLEKLR